VTFFADQNVQVAAEGALFGTESRPARAKDVLVLYANGIEATKPAYPVGQVLNDLGCWA